MANFDQRKLAAFRKMAIQSGKSPEEVDAFIAKKTGTEKKKGIIPTLVRQATGLPKLAGEAVAQTVRTVGDERFSFANPFAKEQKFAATDEARKQQDELFQQSRALIQQAKQTEDPEEKQRLLQQSRELDQQMESGAQKVSFEDTPETFFVDREDIKDRGKIVETGAKKTAGAASLAIPGGATFKTAAGLGAVAGGLGAFSEDEDIVSGALGGAAGGIAGKALSNVAGSIGKGARKVFKSIDNVPKEVRKNLINPKLSKSDPLRVFKEDELLDVVQKAGIDLNNADNMARQMATKFNANNSQIDELLKASTNTIGKADLEEQLTGAIAKNPKVVNTPEYQRAVQAISEVVDNVARQSDNPNVFTPSQVNQIKKAIDVNAAFNKIAKGADLLPDEEMNRTAWTQLKNIVDNLVPEVKPLNKEIHAFYELAPGLTAKASKGGPGIPLAGIRIPGKISQTAQATGAKTIEKGSKLFKDAAKFFPDLNLGGLTKDAGAKIGAKVGETMQQAPEEEPDFSQSPSNQFRVTDKRTGETKVVSGDQLQQFGFDQSGQPLAGGGAFPTQDQLTVAMLKDLQATGGKNIAKIQTIADRLQETATGQKRSGSSEADVAMNVLNEVKKQYDTIQEQGLTGAGPGLGRLQGVKGQAAAITQSSPEASVYKDQTAAFMSLISRGLGEKGVLTDPDIERVKNALPGFTDSPAAAEQKWQTVFNILEQAAMKEDQMSSE